jgi:PmbA protein
VKPRESHVTIDEMKQFAERTVQEALHSGAETAEVSVSEKMEFSVEVRKGAIEKLIESVSSGIHIQLSVERRKAFVSSSDRSDETVTALIREGVELARVMDRDEFFGLPDEDELGAAGVDLNMFDPDAIAIPAEKKIRLAFELEQKALRLDRRIIPDGSSFSNSVKTIAFANSLGFCDAYRRTAHSLALSCAVEDRPERSENIGKRQSSYWYSAAVHAHELDSPDEIASKAVSRTLRKIGARKPKTCEVPVILDPETCGDFLEAIANAVNGGNIYRKSSFLVDRSGTAVGSPLVTIIDDALMPGRLGSHPFDYEGVRARRNVVFDKGFLTSYLLNSYQGRKLGFKTTGNAGGITNFHLKPGSSTPQDIIASVRQGLYLTSLSGPGANWMTGDFSQGGQGLWIENGELSYPVDGFTIASSFPAMLAGIVMVGNDIDWRNVLAAPTIKIERMTLSGT